MEKFEVEVDFYRHVGGGLRELVKTVSVEGTSGTDILKQVRKIKKEIAKECKYNLNGDTITYNIGKVNYRREE